MKKGNLAKYVKDNFPAYKDYDDTDIAEVLGEELGISTQVVKSENLSYLETLSKKFDPNLGKFRSMWRKMKAEARVEYLTVVNKEKTLYTESDFIDEAHRRGITPLLLLQMAQEEIRFKSHKAMTKFNMQVQLQEKEDNARIRLKEKIDFANHDQELADKNLERQNQADKNEIQRAIEAAKLEKATEHKLLEAQMDRLITDIETLKKDTPPGYERMIRFRESTLKMLERKIRDGLHQVHNGKNVGRADQTTEFPGGLREVKKRVKDGT